MLELAIVCINILFGLLLALKILILRLQVLSSKLFLFDKIFAILITIPRQLVNDFGVVLFVNNLFHKKYVYLFYINFSVVIGVDRLIV